MTKTAHIFKNRNGYELVIAVGPSIRERATLGPHHYRGLSQEDAVKRLVRLGFDQHEAQTMISEILS